MLPSTRVARPLCAVLLVQLSLVEFTAVPLGFASAAYLGVVFITTCGIVLGAALALSITDRDAAWVFALVEGLLYVAGYVITRFTGLPFLTERLTDAWSDPTGLTMAYLGAVVSALSAWVLVARRRTRRRHLPVTSARERAALFPELSDE